MISFKNLNVPLHFGIYDSGVLAVNKYEQDLLMGLLVTRLKKEEFLGLMALKNIDISKDDGGENYYFYLENDYNKFVKSVKELLSKKYEDLLMEIKEKYNPNKVIISFVK